MLKKYNAYLTRRAQEVPDREMMSLTYELLSPWALLVFAPLLITEIIGAKPQPQDAIYLITASVSLVGASYAISKVLSVRKHARRNEEEEPPGDSPK